MTNHSMRCLERQGKATQNETKAKQHNTIHPKQLFERKIGCFGWDSNPQHSHSRRTYTYIHSYQHLHVHLYKEHNLPEHTLENPDDYLLRLHSTSQHNPHPSKKNDLPRAITHNATGVLDRCSYPLH